MDSTTARDDFSSLSASSALPADVAAQPWAQALVNENERLRRENQAAADRMERLQAVAAGLVRALTVQDVAETIIREGVRAFGALNGVIYLVTPDGRSLEAPFWIGMHPEALRQHRVIDVDALAPPSQAYRERRRISIESKSAAREQFPAIAEATHLSLAQSWFAVPILSGETALGSFVFGFPDSHRITDDDEALATALSQQCAVAIERARLFEVERHARARADEANRVKMEFLAVMSHELRTPLNAIGGYAQLLEMQIHGPATAEQLNVVERIQRSQRHLLRLINDVLSFAKIDAGHIELSIRDVGVNELLMSLEPLMIPLLTQRTLSYRCEPVDPCITVSIDGDKAQQILLNVLTNAAKFTEPRGSITVSTVVHPESVDISVADSGRGIPVDKLDKIFEPFVQVDASHTRTNEGTGLGLAISRDLARAMKGDITVESEVGRGSVFTLTLPR